MIKFISNTRSHRSFKTIFIYIFLASALFFSCKGSASDTTTEENTQETVTPVTVTTPTIETLSDSIELNATSAMLQKSYIKANIIGYVRAVNTQVNKYVSSGQTLFTLKTKEAESIGNAINQLDSSFKFSGVSNIKASESGYVAELNHQVGDYVQDGEQLAVISNISSFTFLLNLPYELRPYVLNRKTVELTLPDGEKLNGLITSTMPTVDSASQTQTILLKVNPSHPIPENLVAKVKVVKTMKPNATTLPKAAVLTDETETNFWIMKIVGDSTAMKVSVIKGIETADKVEILSPPLLPQDKVVITGNYGLEDKAKVRIEKSE
ncbi:MAG: efflux RND transporter periplasmic adaptor subunit [Parafilimonas sp.]